MIQADEFVCPEKIQPFLDILLSRNTKQGYNVSIKKFYHFGNYKIEDKYGSQIQEISSNVHFFSIAIHESTDVRDTA